MSTQIHIVELTNETDELIGYGVCIEATVQVDERTTELHFTLMSEVYGTRSEAHAAASEVEA